MLVCRSCQSPKLSLRNLNQIYVTGGSRATKRCLLVVVLFQHNKSQTFFHSLRSGCSSPRRHRALQAIVDVARWKHNETSVNPNSASPWHQRCIVGLDGEEMLGQGEPFTVEKAKTKSSHVGVLRPHGFILQSVRRRLCSSLMTQHFNHL